MAWELDDGSEQYLQVESAAVSGPPFAVLAWIKGGGTGAYGIFWIGDGTSGSSYWSLDTTPGTSLLWRRRDGGNWGTATATAAPGVGTWHHVCGIEIADNDRAVLLDKANEGTDNTDRPAGSSPDRMAIGRWADVTPGQYYNGDVAEVAVYDLSAYPGATAADKAAEFKRTTLAAHAAGISAIALPLGRVAYWPGLRTHQDLVGGYDMTPYNSPTWADHPPAVTWAIPPNAYAPAAAAGGSQTLYPSAIASLEAFGTQQLNLALALNGIASLETFGTQQLNLALALNGIASLEAIGSAALVQGGPVIVLTGIEGIETFGTLVLVGGEEDKGYWGLILLVPGKR